MLKAERASGMCQEPPALQQRACLGGICAEGTSTKSGYRYQILVNGPPVFGAAFGTFIPMVPTYSPPGLSLSKLSKALTLGLLHTYRSRDLRTYPRHTS